jgi:hypothetical protein
MQDNFDPNPSVPGRLMDDEEEVIALTRIVAVGPGASSSTGAPPEACEADQDEDAGLDLSRLAAEVVGDPDIADAPGGGSSGTVTLSLDQLEQALEKIVKKLYSTSIESMVMDVMEKHVQREIDKITALIADAAGKEK